MESLRFSKRNKKRLSLPPLTTNLAARQLNFEDQMDAIGVFDWRNELATLNLTALQQERIETFMEEKHKIGELKDDLEVISEIAPGISRVKHKPSNVIMVRKSTHWTPSTRRSALNELNMLHKLCSPYLVGFYGAGSIGYNEIAMFLEDMDGISLDAFLKKKEAVPEFILRMVATSIIEALQYLTQYGIEYRGLKPSKILMNRNGEIKLLYTGQQPPMIGAVVRTSPIYCAPEYILGKDFGSKTSNAVWSLGLCLLTAAVGRCPITEAISKSVDDIGTKPDSKNRDMLPSSSESTDSASMPTESEVTESLSAFDMLSCIVYGPPLEVPDGPWSQEFRDFVHICLRCNVTERASLKDLLDHWFIRAGPKPEDDYTAWITEATTTQKTIV